MKNIFSLIFLFIGSLKVTAQEAALQYTVSLENAVHHEAFINLNISKVPTGPLLFKMSRSSPGRYATHEFGKNIYDLHAYDKDGKEISINLLEGDVYQIPKHQGKVKISYTLFGNWIDGTYTGIDHHHAHFNMPASFIWVPALQNEAIELRFITPKDWKIATQLKLVNGVYHAPNLQYFMDSPVELSDYHLKSWEVQNPDGLKQKINIVLHSDTKDSTFNTFENQVKKLVKEAQAVYGELPRYDFGEYRFLIDILPTNAGDGMEHRNSTIITNKGNNLEQSMEDVLGTVSHEYFHSWNVERIRPKTLEPFNFSKANMSDALWFAEGFTQYYGELLLSRAGINNSVDFGIYQGYLLNAVLNSPGALKYSPIAMSQRAVFVDAGVAIDQNNNSNIYSSYYIYGDIVALALDLNLRSQFNLSLDDYMKAVWKAYGKNEVPYQINDLEKVLANVCKSPDFAKMFFKQYVYGTAKADYATLLAKAGFILRRSQPDAAWMGNNRLVEKEGKVTISSPAIKDTPIYLAGLESGDIIIQLDETIINNSSAVNNLLSTKKPGDYLKVTYQRDGKSLTTNLKLMNNPSLEVVPFEKAGKTLTPEIEAFRTSWLGSKALN